jgi:RNA polymerase sigma factor (TIGR02999 family)
MKTALSPVTDERFCALLGELIGLVEQDYAGLAPKLEQIIRAISLTSIDLPRNTCASTGFWQASKMKLRPCASHQARMNQGTTMSDIAQLLEGARQGQRQAVDQLFTLLYPDLRRIAQSRLRKGSPLTMVGATVLVNESYLRMVRAGKLGVSDRLHFLAYSARVMRSIIVDLVRERMAQRRGVGQPDVTLVTEIAQAIQEPEPEAEILAVSEALDALAGIDAQLVEVVELRYFAGFTEVEVATALGVSERTVRRLWEKARLLLSATLRPTAT